MATSLDNVTIPQSEYKQLKRAALILEYLEGAGVDNWEGYDEAMRQFYKDEGETNGK